METTSRPLVLSLICPVLNEQEVVEIFIDAVTPHIAEAIGLMGESASYEILFVDDGSSDATASIVRRLALKDSRIKLVRLSRNFGKEAALAAGLKYVTGDAAIPIDVDLQDPPELIVQMVAAWRSGFKVVNARRSSRAIDGWAKRATASMFYGIFNKIASREIPANVGDYRLLDREVIDVLNRFTERNRFMKALFSWVGYDQTTIDYVRSERAAGTTKFKYWRLWNFALDGLTGSTTFPLRVWSYLGVCLAAVTLLYAVYLIARTLILGSDVPGYASLIVAILILGSFNMISLGVMGEYIGRISDEVRARPLFVVQETIGHLSSEEHA